MGCPQLFFMLRTIFTNRIWEKPLVFNNEISEPLIVFIGVVGIFSGNYFENNSIFISF